MTPQQLLIPRYEVIAPWPNCPFNIGEILIVEKWRDENYEYKYLDGNEEWQYISEKTLLECPANLRPLHWSERREIGEMPEYVKKDINGEVFKLSEITSYFKKYTFFFLPASETDYLNYINANK